MKRTFFHLIMPAIVGVMLFGLAACNPDVQLGSEENIPEVAEHILGMTKQEAITYLEKQGFFFGNKAEYVDEYVNNSVANGTTKWYSIEEITKWANSSYDQEEKKYKLLEEFNEFISRVDSACGKRCGVPEFE